MALQPGRERRARMSTIHPVRPPINRWLIAISVMSSAVMEVLDTSVVNVSLPHIAGSLSATVDESTWVLTSYLIANAVILPISGWLANIIGRKRLLLIVVSGFTLSSVLCGMAPSLGALIFFRVLQGTTGGGLQPLSQAVLLEEFPPEERGAAMALWGMGIVAAPILGPTLGGWITDTYSWRWVFYINVPIGIFSLLMISQFLYDPPHIRRGKLRVDLWGLGMLAVGMAALQIMLDKGQEEDWFASHFIVVLAVVAVVMLTAFVIRELYTPQPIVRFRLLKHRNFGAGIALITIQGFVLYGSLVLLPLFMQTLLGWTAVTAGFWTSPRGIATAVCMPLVGFLLTKGWDARWMLLAGYVVASLSYFGFSHMSLESGTWDILLHQINQGAGMAFVFVTLTLLTMEFIPKTETGYATSLFSVMRNIGSSIGVSFVTTWLARRSQFHQAVLAGHLTPYDARSREFLGTVGGAFFRHGFSHSAAGDSSLGVLYGVLRQQAALLSFVGAFRIMGFLFLAAAPLVLLMSRAQQRRAASPGE
jgi:DHA2 family multidrug resistance protein